MPTTRYPSRAKGRRKELKEGCRDGLLPGLELTKGIWVSVGSSAAPVAAHKRSPAKEQAWGWGVLSCLRTWALVRYPEASRKD